MRCATLTVTLLALLGPATLAAQSTPDLVAAGIRAYQRLDYAAAAGLLRRGLADTAQKGMSAPRRAESLTYLAAAELFRGARDSARAAFRRAIVLDPRYRPDNLVFPPEVTEVFADVLRLTKVVRVVPPADSGIRAGPGRLVFRLFASSVHDVEVVVRLEGGETVRSVYRGPIADSLDVGWNGLDSTDAPVGTGRYQVIVTSIGLFGTTAAQVQIPLDVVASSLDTLPHPPAPAESTFLPERLGSTGGVRALAGGVLTAAAVVALPAIVASRTPAGGGRFAVVGGVGIAGLVGFVKYRPGRRIASNIESNAARQTAWRAEVDSVIRDNVRRRADVRLRVHAGPPITIVRDLP